MWILISTLDLFKIKVLFPFFFFGENPVFIYASGILQLLRWWYLHRFCWNGFGYMPWVLMEFLKYASIRRFICLILGRDCWLVTMMGIWLTQSIGYLENAQRRPFAWVFFFSGRLEMLSFFILKNCFLDFWRSRELIVCQQMYILPCYLCPYLLYDI